MNTLKVRSIAPSPFRPEKQNIANPPRLSHFHAGAIQNNDQESWMISYVDVLTLLITLFVLLLAYSKVSSLDQGDQTKVNPLKDTELSTSLSIDDTSIIEQSAQVRTPDKTPHLKQTASTFPDRSALPPQQEILPDEKFDPVNINYNIESKTLNENGIKLPTQTPEASWSTPPVQALLDKIYGAQLDDSVELLVNRDSVNLEIGSNVLFARGSAELQSSSYEILGKLVEALNENQYQISIEGHTDNVPIVSSKYPSNWELSSARATNVTRYLISQGIDAKRLRAIGYAHMRPRKNNHTAVGRAENRRVSFVIHLPPDKR